LSGGGERVARGNKKSEGTVTLLKWPIPIIRLKDGIIESATGDSWGRNKQEKERGGVVVESIELDRPSSGG